MMRRVLSALAAMSMLGLALIFAGAAHAQSCAPGDCRRDGPAADPLVIVEGTDASAPASTSILTRSSASSPSALVAAGLGGILVSVVLTGISLRRWQALNERALRSTTLRFTPRAARRAEQLDEATGDRRPSVGSRYA